MAILCVNWIHFKFENKKNSIEFFLGWCQVPLPEKNNNTNKNNKRHRKGAAENFFFLVFLCSVDGRWFRCVASNWMVAMTREPTQCIRRTHSQRDAIDQHSAYGLRITAVWVRDAWPNIFSATERIVFLESISGEMRLHVLHKFTYISNWAWTPCSLVGRSVDRMIGVYAATRTRAVRMFPFTGLPTTKNNK